MKTNEKVRLCGGTYFILMLEARGQRTGVRESIQGEKDGLSEPETLLGLARVVTPDIKDPGQLKGRTISGGTFNFKSCKNYGGNSFMLGDWDAKQSFDERVKNEYSVALNDMHTFVDRFVDVGGSMKKDIKLVRALLDLIEQDESINDDQLFYVCENGNPLTKRQIHSETHFCLDAFLLGVWHYALLRPEGIEIGQDTFNYWCPSKGGKHREYQGSMGVNLDREIKIFRHTVILRDYDETVDDKKTQTTMETEFSDAANEEPNIQPKVTEQNISNPVVYQFVMNGDNGIQIANVENLHAPRKEDQSE